MIRIILIPVLLAFAFAGEAQDSFIQTITDFNISRYNGVFPSNDDLITFGIFLDTTGSTMVRKTSITGETQWTWKAGRYTLGISCGVADRDGNLYLCRYRNDSESVMLKLSPAGDSLWQRPLPGKTPDHISYTHDNHFLLLSQVANGITLSKTDLEGNVLWTRQISHIDLDDEMTGLTHIEMSDETILAVSQSTDPLYNDYLTRFQLFSANGDSLHEFAFTSFNPPQKVLSVCRINSTDVLITGICTGELYEDQSFIARVNVSSGAVVWQKTLLEDLLNSRLLIAGASDDKALLSGVVQFTVNVPQQALSMGINFDGDILFYRGYGENVIHEVAGVCLASDGGIVAAGSTYYNSNVKGFMMKTDRDGFVNVLGFVTEPGLLPLSCYPNPAEDLLCIEAVAGIRMVELFDATGRLVGRFGFNGEVNVTVPLQDLRPGLLTVKVLHDLGTSLKKIIAK